MVSRGSTEDNQTLLIRADAGGDLGTGHVMRMLALAQACTEFGVRIWFTCASCPPALLGRLQAEGIYCKLLESVAMGSPEDVLLTLDIARQCRAGWVALDGYHFNFAYQSAIRAAGFNVMVMDDYGHCERWCADVIINQNFGREGYEYANAVEAGRVLTGTGHALLRREFWTCEPAVNGSGPISRILVTMGGVDPGNATLDVLEALNQVTAEDRLTVRVLVGPANPHRVALEAILCQLSYEVELVSGISSMVPLYQWADGIISAAGSSCYEWLLLGLPGAVLAIADNQLPIVQSLVASGSACLLHESNLFSGLVDVQRLNYWILGSRSGGERSPGYVISDGVGALRVATHLCGEHFFLRPPRRSDARKVFDWANDSTSRAMSFSVEKIPYAEHCAWWTQRLADPDSWIRIIEDPAAGSLGIIRLQRWGETGTAEISINIAPSARGNGIGWRSICRAVQLFNKEVSIKEVVAFARPENRASLIAFAKAGFAGPFAHEGEKSAVVMRYSFTQLGHCNNSGV